MYTTATITATDIPTVWDCTINYHNGDTFKTQITEWTEGRRKIYVSTYRMKDCWSIHEAAGWVIETSPRYQPAEQYEVIHA